MDLIRIVESNFFKLVMCNDVIINQGQLFRFVVRIVLSLRCIFNIEGTSSLALGARTVTEPVVVVAASCLALHPLRRVLQLLDLLFEELAQEFTQFVKCDLS